MKRLSLRQFLLALPLVFNAFMLTSPPAQAADLRLDLIAPGTQVPGRKVLINTGYALNFNIDLPAQFSVFVPDIEGLTAAPQTADDASVDLFKITFAGRNPDAPDDIFLVENIEFFNFKSPLEPVEARIDTMGKFLGQRLFPGLTQGQDQAKTISGQVITVGTYDAVEVIGTYMDAQNGESALRLVAVLHPESEDIVVTVSNIVTKYYTLTNPGDLAMTASGTLLNSFEYLN